MLQDFSNLGLSQSKFLAPPVVIVYIGRSFTFLVYIIVAHLVHFELLFQALINSVLV